MRILRDLPTHLPTGFRQASDAFPTHFRSCRKKNGKTQSNPGSDRLPTGFRRISDSSPLIYSLTGNIFTPLRACGALGEGASLGGSVPRLTKNLDRSIVVSGLAEYAIIAYIGPVNGRYALTKGSDIP